MVHVSQGFWFLMLLAAHWGVFLIKSRAIIGMIMCFGMKSIQLRHGTYSMQSQLMILWLIQLSFIQWISNTLLTGKLWGYWSLQMRQLHSSVPLNKFWLSCIPSMKLNCLSWICMNGLLLNWMTENLIKRE